MLWLLTGSKADSKRAPIQVLVDSANELLSLISGGADASISLWDLESVENPRKDYIYHSIGAVQK